MPRLVAVNPAAAGQGLTLGLGLTDARAILPTLLIADAEPAADAAALRALALWCGRYSPWVMLDGPDGILIDLTGASHLFGGDAGVVSDLAARLERFGLTGRIAVADRPSRARAWARYGPGGVLPAGSGWRPLEDLPAKALGLDDDMAAALRRLGLRRIVDLAAVSRASLLTRFGEDLVLRLDQLLGEAQEPFTPLRMPRRFTARIGWAEPIGRTEDLAAATDELLVALCQRLEEAQEGVRRLVLGLWRVDGRVARLTAGTSRPVRTPGHLRRLLLPQLDGLDIGFGIEFMLLEAARTAPLGATQSELAGSPDEAELEALLDQLAGRLGRARVVRLLPVDSHIPERAQRLVPAGEVPAPRSWLATQPRPLRLLRRPSPLPAMATIPDGPPVRLGGERITAAEGPERILPEWWRAAGGEGRLRDYYRVTGTSGWTLWVFREGAYDEAKEPVWQVHGRFE